MRRREAGQTLAVFALVLPLVLLPLLGYALDSTLLSSRSAILQGAAAQAAEDAVQAIDVSRLRAGLGLQVSVSRAGGAAARSLQASDPQASLLRVAVDSGLNQVTVTAGEVVRLELGGLLGRGTVALTATSRASLRPGYERPSSLSPLP